MSEVSDYLSNMLKGFAIVLMVTGCLSLVVVAGMSIQHSNRQRVSDQFGILLERSGLTIIEATIESPSVLIDVDTPLEFMVIIKELQRDTIYYDFEVMGPKAYFVFNEDMTIAWKYTPKVGD